ncbi:ATP-binding protein [Planococcus sp. CAU13]|uniref:ATP-binding protein n=1 Tax=Planococcus sp. CAU13 TaxID=1541197 RepID=UPI00052FF069|nr:AAA family ATPase [Planococcus sp. CAU13]
MRIEKLTVYGFGKHENLTIPIHEALAVFHGRNEAGKTTLQQFIIQILFGFPSRNHTGSRYEPKAGGKYGGQIQLTDEQFGKVVIERIKGKSAGDVTVYFENGSRGAEPELKKILRDFDRASFEAIFSFSIHELQGLDRMTEEQLSRTLLASGTTGVDGITQLEAELEKEMGLLFKKGGRNPQLNGLIDELRNDEKELKQHREQADLYGPYVEQLEQLNRRIAELTDRESGIAGQLVEAGKQQQAAPLYRKKEELQQQLASITAESFPADGRRRMERVADQISESAAKLNLLASELAAVPAAAEMFATRAGLEELIEKESEWHRFRSAFKDKEMEAEKLKDELEQQLGMIGMPLGEALQFDVSLINEEKLAALAIEAEKEEENSRFRERQLQDEKKKLIEAEKEMSVLENTAPPAEQRAAAEEWPSIKDKLTEAKALQRMGRQKGNQPLAYILAALGIAGVLIGFIQGEFLIGLLAFGAALVGGWMLWQSHRKMDGFEDTDELINRFGGREAELEALQQKINDYDRRVEETLRTIAACDEKIDELSSEIGHKPASAAFTDYLHHLGIASSASKSTLFELFRTIRKVQEIHVKLKRNQEALAEAKKEETEWLEQAAAATGRSIQAADLYTVLRSEAKIAREQSETNRKSKEKREALTKEMDGLNSYLNELEAEKQKLLDECGAGDTEEFYRMHLDWNHKKELQQELALVMNQLTAMGAIEEKPAEKDIPAEKRISELETELSQLKTRRNGLVDERAELQQRVNHLQTDEAYELKLQNFEEKKARFNELAHRWSVNKAIMEAIRETMTELKEKSLPAVLEGACDFFQRLTGNAYSSIEIHPDGHFEAVRNDSMRFRIAELSQATKEQAYLALRFSLAVSMQKSHPFPIIMDDPFVHFDRLRLQQVINLIKELQAEHQFIYFTCHEEMCAAWPEAQVIDVANTGRSVYL